MRESTGGKCAAKPLGPQVCVVRDRKSMVYGGERPPVSGRFRQSDRTPFFWLTPAFGLRSLRKN